MSKREARETFLRLAAVGDASHDFQGSRAKAKEESDSGITAAIFNYIFGKKKYKDIGTPKIPLKDEDDKIYSEAEILNLLYTFLEEGGKGTDEVKKFREMFLKKGANPGEEHVVGTFSRWNGDETPVQITALQLATKDAKDKYVWTRDVEGIYSFLNPHGADNIAFTIDATNFPFYDPFLETFQDPGGSQKKVYYVQTRESINDAALKVILDYPKKLLKTGKEPVVKVETKEDIFPGAVVYPATDVKKGLDKASDLECFFSNYSLSLSPITEVKGIASTTLTFSEKEDIQEKVQLFKTKTEDSHPNSVPTLAQKIKGLLGKLFTGSAATKASSIPEKDRKGYHITLQQKRSGDWLQALSCLQPERFGLAPSTRIMLVTLDKICLAYALFMGVDAVMTYVDVEKREYWLIRFHKMLGTTQKSEFEKLVDKVKELPEAKFQIGGVEYGYEALKKEYLGAWDARDKELAGEFGKTLAEFQTAVDAAKKSGDSKLFPVNEYVRKVVDAALTYALFLTLFPEVQRGAEYSELEALKRETESESPSKKRGQIEKVTKLMAEYKSNYGILKQFSLSLSKADGAIGRDLSKSIIDFMNMTLKLKGGMEKAHIQGMKSIYKVVERLSVYDAKLFKDDNEGANGMGVFLFLKGGLKEASSRQMFRVFAEARDLLDARSKQKYDAFLDTAKLLMEVSNELPSDTEVTNKSLVETLQAVNGAELVQDVTVGPTENVEMERVSPKGEEEEDSFFISDYGAALVVLASRFQADLYGEAEAAILLRASKGGGSATRKKKRSRSRSVSRSRSRSLKTPTPTMVKFEHNPLVTIYFFLREMANRLTYEEDPIAIKTYILLSKQLFNYLIALNIGLTEPINKKKIYNYAYGVEAYLLEAYEHTELFSGNVSVLCELCHTIARSFYGVRSDINLKNQKKYLSQGNVSLAIGDRIETLTKTINIKKFVKRTLEYMKNIPELIERFDALYGGDVIMEGENGEGVESEKEVVKTPSPKRVKPSLKPTARPHSKTQRVGASKIRPKATKGATKRVPKPSAISRMVATGNTEMRMP